MERYDLSNKRAESKYHSCPACDICMISLWACDLSSLATLIVLPGLVPGISMGQAGGGAWMAGTSPAMTRGERGPKSWEPLNQDTYVPSVFFCFSINFSSGVLPRPI